MIDPLSGHRELNASLPIHRLPNELLTEIIAYSIAVRPQTTSEESYVTSLSSICSLWRFMTTTDPRFWTHISLSDASGEPISPIDEERVQTLLIRSGQLPLRIEIDLTDGARTPSLRACLHMLKAELRRCESIKMKTNCVTGWEDAFPLSGDMASLKEMHVVSSLLSASSLFNGAGDGALPVAWNSPINISLFANTPPNLESLRLDMECPYVADLTHINPSSLKNLSLRAYIPHEDAFKFIQACDKLEALELELYADDDQEFERLIGGQEDALPAGLGEEGDEVEGDREAKKEGSSIEGIYCPTLKELSTRGPSAIMLSCIIDAPSLQHLQFTLANDMETFALSYALLQGSQILPSVSSSRSSASTSTIGSVSYPNLQSLTVNGDYHLVVPAESIAAFVTSEAHPVLENLSITRFANTGEVFELLTVASALSSPQLPSSNRAESPSPPPLHSITIHDAPTGTQIYPVMSSLAEPLRDLLHCIPNLAIDWVRPFRPNRNRSFSFEHSLLASGGSRGFSLAGFEGLDIGVEYLDRVREIPVPAVEAF